MSNVVSLVNIETWKLVLLALQTAIWWIHCVNSGLDIAN